MAPADTTQPGGLRDPLSEVSEAGPCPSTQAPHPGPLALSSPALCTPSGSCGGLGTLHVALLLPQHMAPGFRLCCDHLIHLSVQAACGGGGGVEVASQGYGEGAQVHSAVFPPPSSSQLPSDRSAYSPTRPRPSCWSPWFKTRSCASFPPCPREGGLMLPFFFILILSFSAAPASSGGSQARDGI